MMTTHAPFVTRLKACLFACCALAAIPAMSASFHCGKAGSATEQIICNDPQLSAMDDMLAKTYKQARQQTVNRRAFIAASDQQWLWREKNCRDRTCLIDWYQKRQAELQASLNAGTVPATSASADVPAAPSATGAVKASPRLQLNLSFGLLAGVAPKGVAARPHYLRHNKDEYLYQDPDDDQNTPLVSVRYLGIEHGQYIIEAKRQGKYMRYTCSSDCLLIGQLELSGDVESDMVIIENDHRSLPSQMIDDVRNGLLAESGAH